ncbi:reverse transcriptase domain-containing protein [Tanacetum coccineum]
MFGEAWDRFKELLRKCPHHNFSELHQIDTFYNALTQSNQDSLNAAADGNLLNRTPRDALTIIENKSKACTSRNKPIVSKVRTTTSFQSPSPDITALTEMVRELVLMNKANQQASVKAVEETCVTCGGPHPYYECLATDSNAFNASATTPSGSGSLPGNTVARINLMPLSIWKKLSLPELTPTRMTLELANQLVAVSEGVAEDFFIKVGKFYFPADFVVVDYDVDPRFPLILGRPILRTARALIDVHVNVIDVAYEEYAQEVLGFSNSSTSGNPTPSDPIITSSSPPFTPFEGGDFISEEIEACLTNDSIPPGIDDADFDPKGDLLLLKKLLNDDPSSPLPPKELNFEELKTIKSSIDDP